MFCGQSFDSFYIDAIRVVGLLDTSIKLNDAIAIISTMVAAEYLDISKKLFKFEILDKIDYKMIIIFLYNLGLI